ncbi:MAG TPA: hypothetical protein EYN70_00835 [Planctomycetaceae bacterium]|nr:hypothetical protein [Planctomycetaceae bacterium]
MATMLVLPALGATRAADKPTFRLARFSADVTIPLNHRCMGVLPTKSKKIVDPLFVHGFVLLGPDKPIVLAAFDWCEIRNGAYDQWRDALAAAAGTTRQRVLVSSLHQHDAPVIDLEAQQMLDQHGLVNELYDMKFHEQTLKRVAKACRDSLQDAVPVTHLGLGQAKVGKVASNRRVQREDGTVTFGRGSNSGGNAAYAAADDGLIDPWLKTISFWNESKPLLALHAYATHPMSYYGRGGVTSDFVGLAREKRRRDDFSVGQIYVSGCSGDVTAGKYNDGSPDNRPVLAERMYQAMKKSWESTKKSPLRTVGFRTTQLQLKFNDHEKFALAALKKTLADNKQSMRERILAAMGLSSLQRIARGQAIDMPCVDFGEAQILLFPGEAFVGYQLMAQKLRPDSFVMSIGYGECWPGYVPTKTAFDDNFGHSWRWVAPGAQGPMTAAMKRVLLPKNEK